MENKDTPEYLHKIDTSKPGVYIARLNTTATIEQMHSIKKCFKEALGEKSKFIILSCDFDPVFVPDEKTMNKLGYTKTAT